jgi:hypothetical protein
LNPGRALVPGSRLPLVLLIGNEDDFFHFYSEHNSFGLKENGTIPF